MNGENIEIRKKASRIIAREAMRLATRGKKLENLSEELKRKGWEPSHGLMRYPIDRKLLREAELLYAEAAKLFPEGTTMRHRALVLMDLGDFENAIETFKNCLACDGYAGKEEIEQQVSICRELQAIDASPDASDDQRSEIFFKVNQGIFHQTGKAGVQLLSDFEELTADTLETCDPDEGLSNEGKSSSSSRKDETNTTTVCEFSEDFVWLLVNGDYEKAHELLSNERRATLSADDLKESFTDMTEYFDTPVNDVEAFPPSDFLPDPDTGEIAWIYVSFSSEESHEAVSFTICREDGNFRINSLEWGRP